jgi:hypothetical protein
MNSAAIVLVPVYRPHLSQTERISLTQTIRVLGRWPMCLIGPIGLDYSAYRHFDIPIETFEDRYFEGIEGYNRLLLGKELYERFLDYGYALIAQMDSFVFSDELDYWCDQRYCFIGAPWTFNLTDWGSLSVLPLLHRYRLFSFLRKPLGTEYLVGNGGFSLRSIKECYRLIDTCRPAHGSSFASTTLNEDVFWGLVAPRIFPTFKVPKFPTALRFAFEVNPRYCYQRNDFRLPFGCHGWETYDITFWKPIIESYGYTIDTLIK